jgi:hypothetical protein
MEAITLLIVLARSNPAAASGSSHGPFQSAQADFVPL